jgi:hypothetical protein
VRTLAALALRTAKHRLGKVAWILGSRRQSPQNTIFITGSPRSGTTWLLEILETIPRTRRIYEPFGPPFPCADVGWRPYRHEEEEYPCLERYVRGLLTGSARGLPRIGPHSHTLLRQAVERTFPRQTVIKSVRAQRLLPWLARRFDLPMVLLIRHPLSVVSSQLRYPFEVTPKGAHPVVCERLAAEYPHLAEIVDSLSYPEQKLAASWAFDYLVPLSRWKSCNGVLLLGWEDLVNDPQTMLGQLEGHCGVSFPQEVFTQLATASATTRGCDTLGHVEVRVRSWERRLSSHQISRIMDVVRQFGISVYNEDSATPLLDDYVSSPVRKLTNG